MYWSFSDDSLIIIDKKSNKRIIRFELEKNEYRFVKITPYKEHIAILNIKEKENFQVYMFNAEKGKLTKLSNVLFAVSCLHSNKYAAWVSENMIEIRNENDKAINSINFDDPFKSGYDMDYDGVNNFLCYYLSKDEKVYLYDICLLYTSPSPRD